MDKSPNNSINPQPTKSRRGRKRVTDPVLANELKKHRRSRANDRERTRMRLLNEALEHLRTILPNDYFNDSNTSLPIAEDKLTKIETLRTASAYIRLLTSLLEDNPTPSSSYEYSPIPTYNYASSSSSSSSSSLSSYAYYGTPYAYYHPYC